MVSACSFLRKNVFQSQLLGREAYVNLAAVMIFKLVYLLLLLPSSLIVSRFNNTLHALNFTQLTFLNVWDCAFPKNVV